MRGEIFDSILLRYNQVPNGDFRDQCILLQEMTDFVIASKLKYKISVLLENIALFVSDNPSKHFSKQEVFGMLEELQKEFPVFVSDREILRIKSGVTL